MRSLLFRILLVTCCICLFISSGHVFAQSEPEKPTVLEKYPEPTSLENQSSALLPMFEEIRVTDNPDDSSGAILIDWLVAKSPAIDLFKGEIPDEGQFGDWIIEKDSQEMKVCKDGEKKKAQSEKVTTSLAHHASEKNLVLMIFRANSVNQKPGEFMLIGQTPIKGEVRREEHRFNEGSEDVYYPDSKLHYATPGKRKAQYRYWMSYVDDTVEHNTPYFYRIAIKSGDDIAYGYRTIPVEAGENRTQYNKTFEFGPVLSKLNTIESDSAAQQKLVAQLGSDLSPPTNANAIDNPSDSGNAVKIEWIPSADDLDVASRKRDEKTENPNPVEGYAIFRSELIDGQPGPYNHIGNVGPGLTSNERDTQKFSAVKMKSYVDFSAPKRGWNADKCEWYTPSFSYIVAARSNGEYAFSKPSAGASSKTQWLDRKKISFLVAAFLISAAIIWFIQHIKSGKKLFVRKIAGLDAIDEAIGRATEMGRPIIFIPGIQDMNDVQTVSAVIIMGRIAKTIAEYDTKFMVPTSRSLVMTTARETVKEAYLSAGRPDAYNDNMITYLTDEQFGYVAGVNGIMVREKPATCFFLGAFFAESLILAETGNSIGAVQIAGTAMPSQLPFFIAACDYTLIGEELFAASAYLSNDPKQLGSLKGQDMGKLIAMLAVFVGTAIATIAELSGSNAMQRALEFFRNLFQVT